MRYSWKKIESRVKDPTLLRLIKTGLKARIFLPDKSNYTSELGVPQGGILSPLLSNIYLDCFDKFMETKIQTYNKGSAPKHNKQYETARYYKKSTKGIISYNPFDPTYRKLVYVRYADDFMVGIRGPIKDCFKIKEEIKLFLDEELKITLSSEKTKITHVTDDVQFLGHRLVRKAVRVFTKYHTKSGPAFRKSKHHVYGIDAVHTRVIKKLITLGMVGFIKKNGRQFIAGMSYESFIPYQQSEIILKYNSIIRGLSEWFKHAGNRRTTLNFISYLLHYSAAKTLAQKYNTSMKKIFTLAGKDLSIPIKKLNAVGVTDEQIAKWQSSINSDAKIATKLTPFMYTEYNMIPNKIEFKYGLTWKPEYLKILDKLSKKVTNGLLDKLEEGLSEGLPKEFNFLQVLTRGLDRTIKLLNAVCTICGTNQNIQIHHVKSTRSIKGENYKEKSFIRKQIPLCEKCHLAIHKGNWRNPPKSPTQL